MLELLIPEQMGTADATAIASGIPGTQLMESAGKAVADTLIQHYPNAKTVLVICGTGNNGGDGFVCARHLQDYGLTVTVYLAGEPDRISGDARWALKQMDPALLVENLPAPASFDCVVDALFGAGLDREVSGTMAELINALNDSGTPVIAVDLPSGIDGRTGKVMGAAIKAQASVTFFRYKPGHFLLPGRLHCGGHHLAQIGIGNDVLNTSGVEAFQNEPDLWREQYPFPHPKDHKYHRGHALVISGPPAATGAARLTAVAALRSGAGLVTLATTPDALAINASHLTSVMLHEYSKPTDLQTLLRTDTRFNTVALGPGLPPDGSTQKLVTAILAMNRNTVLDAGALMAFRENPGDLFDAISRCLGAVVLTPHDGEFANLFPGIEKSGSRLERAKEGSKISNAIVILKGADTVAATPDGEASIASNAPPWLATAGSGDVLTGIVAGLLAQGMAAFAAASAAVWLHGEAANQLGPGMISSDLDEGLKLAIKYLTSDQ